MTDAVPRTFMFVVPGEPRGKGRPRATTRGKFVKLYTDAQTASYENLVKLAWKQEVGAMAPLTGPVSVEVIAHFAIPKSASKKTRGAMLVGRMVPVKRPDLDNCIKAVLDGLNGIAFVDDAQVAHLEGVKVYSDTPRLVVTIRQFAL